MQAAKKRSSRATAEQYNLMLDFFVANTGLAEGRFVALHGRQEAAKKWEELAGQLNSVGGAEKSGTQWQVAWRDLKCRTSVKARARRKQMASTGGKPLSLSALTELDMRVLGILGPQYVEGSITCADSIPEEEHLQIALESGENDVLLSTPTVPNVLLSNPTVPNMFDVDEVEDVVVLEEVVEVPAKKRRTETERTTSKRTVPDAARVQFATIATQQANAISLQAEASKQLAEAAKEHAEAATLQSRALDRIASALEILAQTMAPSYLDTSNGV